MLENEIAVHQREAIERILDVAESSNANEKGGTYLNASAYMTPGTGATTVAIKVAENLCRLGSSILVVSQTNIESEQAFQRINENPSTQKPVITVTNILEDDIETKQFNVTFSSVTHIQSDDLWEFIVGRFDVVVFLNIVFTRKSTNTQAIRKHLMTTQRISISPTPLKWINEELFGKPVYEYGIEEGIRNRILEPIDYFIKLKQRSELPNSHAFFESALHSLLDDIRQKRPSKILIVCKSIDNAKLVRSILISMSDSYTAVLLTSQEKDINFLVEEFTHSEEYQIGITVNLHLSFDIDFLTDIILFKKFSSEAAFLKTISKVNKASKPVTGHRVWDCAGNAKWMKEAYGKIFDYSNDRSIRYKANDETEILEDNSLRMSLSEEQRKEIVKPFVDTIIQAEKEKQALETNEQITELEPEETKVIDRYLINPHHDKSTKEDLLGRKGLVSILKGVIDQDSRKHFIIALFGRWGSGKSSVIDILMDRYVDIKETHFVVFNAWQNEHSQNMTASIAKTIVDSVYDTKTAFGKFWLSLIGQWRAHRSTILFYSIVSVLILTVCLFYVGTPILADKGSTISLKMSALIAAILTAVPIMFWSGIRNPFVSQLKELSKKPNFDAHIGVPGSIKDQLDGLLKIYPRTIKPSYLNIGSWPARWKARKDKDLFKYILVVDDLDRCSDKKIIEILETVQLVIDLDDVVVILVVDDDILLRAIANLYQSQRKGMDQAQAFKIAREYLGKILQVTITLDKPSIASRKHFIKERLYKELEIKEPDETEFVDSLGFDPSELSENKRLRNIAESASLFDYEDYYDEDNHQYDETDEYLHPDVFEFEFFKVCMQTFEVDNPRTMLRLHNVVTFVKGLYPEVAQNEEDLKLYIYLVFWYEKYQSTEAHIKEHMTQSVGNSDKGTQEQVNDLAEAIDMNSRAEAQIKKALYRVKNLSLPVLEKSRKSDE